MSETHHPMERTVYATPHAPSIHVAPQQRRRNCDNLLQIVNHGAHLSQPACLAASLTITDCSVCVCSNLRANVGITSQNCHDLRAKPSQVVCMK